MVAGIMLSLIIGLIIGLVSFFFFDEIFYDNRALIVSIVIMLIVMFVSFGFLTPIRTEQELINATITKMEETATNSTIHRHVYAVTEDGEGIMINASKSEYALLNTNDKLRINRKTTTTLFKIETVTYEIASKTD